DPRLRCLLRERGRTVFEEEWPLRELGVPTTYREAGQRHYQDLPLSDATMPPSFIEPFVNMASTGDPIWISFDDPGEGTEGEPSTSSETADFLPAFPWEEVLKRFGVPGGVWRLPYHNTPIRYARGPLTVAICASAPAAKQAFDIPR